MGPVTPFPLPRTVTAVLATGHGQSEDPNLSLCDGARVQNHDLNPLW